MNLPKKIQDAILHNTLVVFAGSGLSTRFNLPNWRKLVEDVIFEIDRNDYKAFIPVLECGLLTPIEVLEKLKPEHNIIRKYIKNNFNIKDGDFGLHKKILDLTNQVITTNYDNAFEQASKNRIIPTNSSSTFNISELNKTDEPYIFKLHGSFSESDHCIVLREDYDNLYLKETAAKDKLKSIFSDKTILFLGFSFSDPDINLIFNTLDLIFDNNNKHVLLTKDNLEFQKFKFLEIHKIDEYLEIDSFIDECLKYKAKNNKVAARDYNPKKEEVPSPKIAILFPNPIDLDFRDEISGVVNCFDSLDATLNIGTLNLKTLATIDDCTIIVIVSKVFKSNLYIEDDNMKSSLLSPDGICSNVPNDKIPIVFITNEKISLTLGQPTLNIATFKHPVIKRFIYKALREGLLDFNDPDISVNLKSLIKTPFLKGKSKSVSIYNNNKNLEIGKKCLLNVIGRIEEQGAIALKLISIIKSNKFLNIKASGGTGKTTVIKKVAYELYNRGYFKEGVTFKSCESVKTFADFEEILIAGFNLTNIINFKGHLIENYSNNKLDLLVILDNFETVVNNLIKDEFLESIELLKFATDYANIVVTSREKLSPSDDFEDVYSLTPLITDDSLVLFLKYYGPITDEGEIKILRQDILEELLNNNPLAIKLVTKSRVRSTHIEELRVQLKNHFFESINEDYTLVFKNNADLNIERTKSIYQSINYSYTTLNSNEKIAFELLSLFPDGISLSNFKKCFEKKLFSNSISDKELRVIKDKSLVEDYNGTLQLQPIIRKFADYQFSKRPNEVKQKYCSLAYSFNTFILEIIDLIGETKSISAALKFYNSYKNNLMNVLSYLKDIKINLEGRVPEKKYLLNFIYGLDSYIVSEKQVSEFHERLFKLKPYFSDLPNAETLIQVLDCNKTYYYQEFDNSYIQLSKLLSIDEMGNRVFENEDYIETIYKNIISNIYSIEGHTILFIKSYIENKCIKIYMNSPFFYLGMPNIFSRKKEGFYHFEYLLMFEKLNILELEEYINSLYTEEHLEIMQCTYTLSKCKELEKKIIQKLVVTNPYTKGLKELMFAFISKTDEIKIRHFEEALINLSHIKYYYLEALYYYCLYLKGANPTQYVIKVQEGIELTSRFYYKYLNFLFTNLESDLKKVYNIDYSYYPLENLESYVKKHNEYWEKEFKGNSEFT